MSGIFNPENKFWDFIGKLADVTFMSMLWLITSLPIVTVGAATTAFYDFTMHQVNDREGTVWRSYFRSFRKNFRRGTAIWLIELAAVVFFGFDFWAAWKYFVATGGVWSIVVLGMTACALILVLLTGFYAYPMLATFDFPVKKLVTNSFIMAVGNLPTTLVILLIFGIAAVASYYLSGIFFIFFGLAVFFSSYFFFAVFWRYTEKDEDEEDSEEDLASARAKKLFSKKK